MLFGGDTGADWTLTDSGLFCFFHKSNDMPIQTMPIMKKITEGRAGFISGPMSNVRSNKTEAMMPASEVRLPTAGNRQRRNAKRKPETRLMETTCSTEDPEFRADNFRYHDDKRSRFL
jgi:hypothetical protein